MSRSRIIAVVPIAIFTALLWIGGESVSVDWVRYASLATSAATVLVAAYEKWLWAIIPVGRSRRPVLRGTWSGRLVTHWPDPETGQAPGPRDCYLVIRQTASTIRATLLTDESRSSSAVAELADNDGGTSLCYIFRNQPQIQVDHRSTAHHGAVVLEIDSGGTRLEGHYWTDRYSRGELEFGKRVRKYAATFAEATDLQSLGPGAHDD
ncbi:hypothetical protein [Candidatus Poriferisocius sp.]|uniref:Cap15 family cyclic dinucleotide receptor domain-containing protein n=1 Tax=Candidatus Poriferisocius sp. TaxID=3101276 RepID=UPI003B59215E